MERKFQKILLEIIYNNSKLIRNASLNKGYFIVFEGLDGSGKSTQVKLLENLCKMLKISVLVSKWNSSEKISKLIKELKNTNEDEFLKAYSSIYPGRNSKFEVISFEDFKKEINESFDITKDKIGHFIKMFVDLKLRRFNE